MSVVQRKEPNEIVAERIIAKVEKGSLLTAKKIELLRQYFESGSLPISNAEMLFEFERPAPGAKK